MSTIQEVITSSVPFEAIRGGTLDKDTWFMWLRELEQILRTGREHETGIEPSFIIPLTIDGIYLKVILNGLRIEGVALYEKSKSYRICVANNYKIFSVATHDVHHINGLAPIPFSLQEKQSLYA